MNTPQAYLEQQVVVPSPVLLSELMLHENHYNDMALSINRRFQRTSLANVVHILEDDVDPSVLAFQSGMRPNARIPATVVQGTPSVMREATEKNSFSPFKAITNDFSNLVGTVEDNLIRFGKGLSGWASRFLGHLPSQSSEPDVPRDFAFRKPVTDAKTMVSHAIHYDTPWRELNQRFHTEKDTQLMIVSVAVAAILIFPLF